MPTDNAQPTPTESAVKQTQHAEDLALAQQMRVDYRAMIPDAGTPDPVAEVRDITIQAQNPARTIPARLYVPTGANTGDLLPVVLFLHGGGFVSGDLETHDVLIRGLANRSGALVLSLDWRLAPEHPFPAGLDDAYAALEWLASNGAEIGADGNRVAIAGDSAGGSLSAALTIAARERGGPAIAAQLLLYPNAGNAMDTASWAELGNQYFPTFDVMTRVLRLYVPEGGEQVRNPLVSPLQADLHGLPTALVITGELDPLRDEGEAYAEKLSASGVATKSTRYPGVEHGFVQFYKAEANVVQGDAAVNEAADFLRSALAN